MSPSDVSPADGMPEDSIQQVGRSLKSRLTLSLLAGIGLPLLLAALVVAVVVPRMLRQRFDESLETRARALVSLTIVEDGVIDLEFSDNFMPEFQDDEEPYFFELWVDGDELERSRSFHPERGVRLPDLELDAAISNHPRLSDMVLPDGRDGRLVRIDFVPEIEDEDDEEDDDDDEEEPFEEDDPIIPPRLAKASGSHRVASVLVAGSTEDLDDDVAQIRGVTAGSAVVLLGLLAAFVRVVLAVGLRPVEGVVRQVAEINAESLAQRVDQTRSPKELAPLLDAFNRLLDRVETAFQRERQLTADMAHELKTPIAELRNLGEVGERWPDDREAAVKFFADAKTIAQQMERVVVHLLALARHDAGRTVTQLSPVSPRQLVSQAWRPHAGPAAERGLSLDMDVDATLRVTSDASKLDLILANLLSNAVSYSKPGTTIRCAAAVRGETVVLSVSNEAEDLEPDDLDVMFDRFWRKDEARTGGRSAGLGLALVRAFATLLEVEVRSSLSPTGTLRIDLVLPVEAREDEPRGRRPARAPLPASAGGAG